MKRKGRIKLFFALIIFTFLISGIFAAAPEEGTCAITAKADCVAPNTIVIGLSAQTDSHGALFNSIPSNYNYVLCCGGRGTTTCDGSNKIIGLSSSTNAHAETPASTVYPSADKVCFGNLQCVGGADSCGAGLSLNYPISIISLSTITNSHLFPYGSGGINICCKGVLTYTCSLKSAYWGTSEAVKGVTEQINVEGSGSECMGKEVSLIIKKRGLLGDTTVVDSLVPTKITFDSTGKAIGTWDTSNTAIGDKYYFVTTLTEDTTKTKQSNDLTILDSSICADISSCNGYATQSNCGNDVSLCNVATSEIESTQGTGFCNTHNCKCSWDGSQPSGQQCGPSWSSIPQTGCGNNIQEFGEQCDDGNVVSGDGCSSTCTSESTTGPCASGLTLCSDGTCSLGNCPFTDTAFSSCNYNGVCDSGEGCTCSDCNTQQDTCIVGLTCNTASGLNGPACCKTTSDGVCTSGCESIDPDCTGTGEVCGNGKLEFPEQCDLGTGINGATGSGCDSNCKLVSVSSSTGCGEGLNLCSDGTCSLNCFTTDKGLGNCSKGTDNPNTCCKTGLSYDKISLACCNPNSDGKCNQYCSYIDPDCTTFSLQYEPGTCRISQSLTKDCNTDPVGYKTLQWTGIWNGTQSGTNYQTCTKGGTVTVPCPAQVQLPFFDYLELIGSILVIALVYVGLVFKKKIFKKK